MAEEEKLKIDIGALRKAATRVFDELEARYPEIDLTNRGWYWVMLSPGKYDFEKPPSDPAVGDLKDDWEEMVRISKGSEATSLFADLDNLGNLLCAISDELTEAE